MRTPLGRCLKWVKMRRARIEHMSAGSDVARRGWHGRKVPGGEITTQLLDITSSARFRARSRIARCEVRYNREKILLVEVGYNLGHQRAPFSRSGAVPEVIELPEHVAR